MKILLTYLLFITLTLCFSSVKAAIVLDSTSTTTSSCQNNGTISIYAHDNQNTLSYSITAGPVTRPLQTGSTFASLPEGVYSILIKNSAGQSLTQTVTLSGNYLIPNPQPKVIYPVCRKSNDYRLIGNVDSASGKAPYTWQLVSPSPVTTGPQHTDTFHVNIPGTYRIQVTDACGDIQTRDFTFAAQGQSSNINPLGGSSDYFIGCDSAYVAIGFNVFTDSNASLFPVSMFVTNTNSGAVGQYIISNPLFDTIIDPGYTFYQNFYSNSIGYTYANINMGLTVPGSRAGDPLQVLITDGCHDSLIVTSNMPAMALTTNGFSTSPYGNCGYASNTGYSYTMPSPNNWQLIDNTTNLVVDTGSSNYLLGGFEGISLEGFPPGRQYTLIVTDRCGDTLRDLFYWQYPIPTPLSHFVIFNQYGEFSCMDSTASASLNFRGYGKGILTILSGPRYLQSSKPGYAYLDSITYPISFPLFAGGGVSLEDLPAGTYIYHLQDSCGHDLLDSFTVDPSQLISFDHHFSYIKGCVGANKLVLDFTGLANLYVYVNDLQTGLGIYGNSFNGVLTDTLFNIPAGSYVLTTNYQLNGTSLLKDSNYCARTHDTIIIPPYQNPLLTGFTLSSCGSTFYLHCIADSSSGLMPFSYSIVSGPDSFPAQSSNTFTLTQPGSYGIRLFDACGNSGVKQITIDSVPGPSIITTRTDSCYHAIVNGHTYTTNTVLRDTINTALGCDSIIFIDSVMIHGDIADFHIFAHDRDTFCSGNTNVLSSDQGFATYHWFDGSQAPTHAVLAAGAYALTVTDSLGCAASDVVVVSIIDPPYVSSGWLAEANVCPLVPLTIILTLGGSSPHYEWDRTDAEQFSLSRTISDSGIFHFTVSNYCGSKVYTMNVTPIHCIEELYIPNAFTPNGDGTNDVFQVFSSYPARLFSLSIFNRWGEKIFSSSDMSQGWDGRYQGQLQEPGTYIYQAEITSYLGDTAHKKGSITLIR